MSFRCDTLKGVVSPAVGIVFSQDVVRMVIDDWERLYQLTEVLLGRMIKVADMVEGRARFRLGAHDAGLWSARVLTELSFVFIRLYTALDIGVLEFVRSAKLVLDETDVLLTV